MKKLMFVFAALLLVSCGKMSDDGYVHEVRYSHGALPVIHRNGCCPLIFEQINSHSEVTPIAQHFKYDDYNAIIYEKTTFCPECFSSHKEGVKWLNKHCKNVEEQWEKFNEYK